MSATISSHTLNGLDGTHAGGIAVTLCQIGADGARLALFETKMDEGGRLSQEVDLDGADPAATYEMTFATGPYWEARQPDRTLPLLMREVVLRFAMPDPRGRYHMPVILSPNSYSVWCSS